MSLLGFCEWLATTQGSIALHESLLMYPLVESIHVWALCLFVGFVAMLDLRLLGWKMRRVPASEVAGRLLPWARVGFVVMVVSGVLLFYAIPVRTYHSIFFRFKVLMLILAGLNAWLFHARVYRTVARWDLELVPPRAARVAGAVSLALWASIIVTGRMIAYDWFDCEKPQSAIVTLLTGCPADSP